MSDVVKLTGDVYELVDALNDANKPLDGMIVRLGKLSQGQGAKWTTFSRISSAAGLRSLWRVQNAIRGIADMAFFWSDAVEKQNKLEAEARGERIKQIKHLKEIETANNKIIEWEKEAKKITDQKILDAMSVMQTIDETKVKLEEMYKLVDEESIESMEATNKWILGMDDLKTAALEAGDTFVEADAKLQLFEEHMIAVGDAFTSQKEKVETLGGRKEETKLTAKPSRGPIAALLGDFGEWAGDRAESAMKMFGIAKKGLKFAGSMFLFGKKGDAYTDLKAKWEDKIMRFHAIYQLVGKHALKFIFYTLFFMALVLLLISVIYSAWDYFQVFMPIVEFTINSLFAAVQDIFKFINAVIKGDFPAAIEHGVNFILNMAQTALGFIGILLAGAFVFIVGLWDQLPKIFFGLIDWFKEDGAEKVLTIGLYLVGIWLGLYFIQYMIGQVMLILAIYALPVLVTIVIIAGLWVLIKWIVGEVSPSKWFGGGKAEGGTTTGGFNLVGEKGPELVSLPKGSRVHSNSDSKKMVGGGNIVNNITVNVQGRIGASDAELRQIAQKVGSMINKEINRSTSSRTMG